MKIKIKPEIMRVGDRIVMYDEEFVIVSPKANLAAKIGEDPFILDEPYSTTSEHAQALTGRLYPYGGMTDRDGFMEVIRS